MPLGIVLDYFVYPEHLVKFLELRLLCSLLVIVIWSLHSTSIARKHYPVVGLFIVILPAFFIAWMVYATGPVSPYYAGLNLILLAVSVVVRWNMSESLLAVGGVQSDVSGRLRPQRHWGGTVRRSFSTTIISWS